MNFGSTVRAQAEMSIVRSNECREIHGVHFESRDIEGKPGGMRGRTVGDPIGAALRPHDRSCADVHSVLGEAGD
jgi:hypothetical protein